MNTWQFTKSYFNMHICKSLNEHQDQFIAHYRFYHSINLCNYFGGGWLGESTRPSRERKVGVVIVDWLPGRALHRPTLGYSANIQDTGTHNCDANCPGLSITPGNNLGYITLGTQTCLNNTALPFPCLKAEIMTKVLCCSILGPRFRHN